METVWSVWGSSIICGSFVGRSPVEIIRESQKTFVQVITLKGSYMYERPQLHPTRRVESGAEPTMALKMLHVDTMAAGRGLSCVLEDCHAFNSCVIIKWCYIVTVITIRVGLTMTRGSIVVIFYPWHVTLAKVQKSQDFQKTSKDSHKAATAHYEFTIAHNQF